MNDEEITQELIELGDKVFLHPLENSPNAKLLAWKQTFGTLSPSAVHKLVSKKFEETKIELYQYEKTNIKLQHKIVDNTAFISLYLYTKEPSHISIFSFDVKPPAGQSKRISTQALANLVELIETEFVNTKQVTLLAIHIGCYAWTKFGFVPQSKDWLALKEFLKKRVEKIDDQLTKEEKAAMETILASEDPKSIWLIADMAKPITLPKETREIIKESLKDPLTLGKYLLAFSYPWEGALDLSDPEAVNRLKGYLAKLTLTRNIPKAEKETSIA